ncbi:MAG: aldolase [Deltaproteobacteria bacterium]|nr:aldolase [Deltaproteobacteria bacterium]
MPQTRRLNKVIELLEQGKVVFGGAIVLPGNIDDAIAFGDVGYDFLIFEMEHEGFDMPKLRLSLQFLLDRKRLVTKGTLQPDMVPFVRVPPNAREQNQWVLKQTLDTGVYGLIVPHLDTVEQARAAVIACRYPQALEAPDREPAGQRGWAPMWAARYWGLSLPEYTAAADLWPLDPQGEMFFMPLIEGVEGVRNLPQILREVKGIGAIWAGSGDLAMELGLPCNFSDPRVEEGMQQILKACKQFNVPCACIAFREEDVERRIEQGFRIIITIPTRTDRAFAAGKKLAGR